MQTQETESARVKAFQDRIGADEPRLLITHAKGEVLEIASEELSCQSFCAKMSSNELKGAWQRTKDARLLRAELIMEECHEMLEALSKCDEVALLDALADLIYVVKGTAVTFCLPIEAAFTEVHDSNMTKTPGLSHADGHKGKGPDFKPADIAGVIAQYRFQKAVRE